MMEKAILSIETSQSLCSVCIYFSEDKYFEIKTNLKNTHSEKIFQLLESLYKISDTSLENIESVAFSSGPGSFTGLRIGISAAKGISFAAGLPVIPVPTFEAMAYQVFHYLKTGNEFVIANKVNMDELYYARFKVSDNKFIFTENLKIINSKLFDSNTPGVFYFGNAVTNNFNSAPDARYIAKYAKAFSLEKVVNFDNLEPLYMKSFTIKEKQK